MMLATIRKTEHLAAGDRQTRAANRPYLSGHGAFRRHRPGRSMLRRLPPLGRHRDAEAGALRQVSAAHIAQWARRAALSQGLQIFSTE